MSEQVQDSRIVDDDVHIEGHRVYADHAQHTSQVLDERRRELLDAPYELPKNAPIGIAILGLCGLGVLIASMSLIPIGVYGAAPRMRLEGFSLLILLCACSMWRTRATPVSWGLSLLSGIGLVLVGVLVDGTGTLIGGLEVVVGVFVLVAALLSISKLTGPGMDWTEEEHADHGVRAPLELAPSGPPAELVAGEEPTGGLVPAPRNGSTHDSHHGSDHADDARFADSPWMAGISPRRPATDHESRAAASGRHADRTAKPEGHERALLMGVPVAMVALAVRRVFSRKR